MTSQANHWLKISHHRHTGRLRPHEFTSYFPLLILLMLVGVILAVDSVYAAQSTSPNTSQPLTPLAGSVSLSGTMPGHPPKTGAVITSPDNNSSFSSSPITVSGTCPDNTIVEIYKNDIFAGSTPCQNGQFSLQVGLLFGPNQLTAKVYNAVNQEGPQSNTVTTNYSVLPAQGAPLESLNLASQLIIETSTVFRGVFPSQTMEVPISIIGGTPPYAVNIEWGDSTNDVISRSNDEAFSTDHVYQKAGTFQIILQATDAQGRVAFLSVAAIVNGQPPVAAATSGNSNGSSNSKIMALWPLWTASVAIVISFWLGERREKHVLAEHPALKLHLQH